MFTIKFLKAILVVTKSSVKRGLGKALESVEVRCGVATVTDSHRMYQFPVPGLVDGLYHHNDLDLATKRAAIYKTDVNLADVSQVSEDLRYPMVECIIPSVAGKTPARLNAVLLRDLCDVAIAGHKDAEIEIYLPDIAESPVLAHFLVGETAVARGLLMQIKRRDGYVLEYNPVPNESPS